MNNSPIRMSNGPRTPSSSTMTRSLSPTKPCAVVRPFKIYSLHDPKAKSRWQEKWKQQSGCIRNPSASKFYADAVLLSSDGIPFYVHRFILSNSCDYFDAAFDKLGGDTCQGLRPNADQLMEIEESFGDRIKSTPSKSGPTHLMQRRSASSKNTFSAERRTLCHDRATTSHDGQKADDCGVSMPTINFDDIQSDVLEIVINYCYADVIDGLTVENMERVLSAFDRFNLGPGLERCHEFLVKNVNISNCLSIFRLGHKYWSRAVIEAARCVILYEARSLSDHVLTTMTFEELYNLLSDDRLNVSREEQTYSFIQKWIEANQEDRTKYFPMLMSTVRFGNAALKFIENELLTRNPWIAQFPELATYLKSANEVLQDIQADPVPSKFDVVKFPFLRPRIPRDIIFTFGGWSGASATSVIETYDSRVNKWYKFDTIDTQSRAYHGMVNFNGLIYIIGGFDGSRHFSSVVAFNPVTKEWFEKANMTRARCYVSTVTLGGYIYACGGFDGQTRTDTCERYDPERNQWSSITSMNHNRSDASASVLNGKIYIAGGFDGTEVLSSCEVFDPLHKSWTLVDMMNSPRSGVQMVTYEDCLYVFGGNDGQERQTSAEKYEPGRSGWQPIPEMKTPRSNFSAVVLEGLIYIVGGFNGQTTINEVECYDPKKNTWHDMWSMVLHRSALSACVMSRLPNGKEYTWLRRELQVKSTPVRKSISRRRSNPILS